MRHHGPSDSENKAEGLSFVSASPTDVREAALTFLGRFVDHAGGDPDQLWADTRVSPGWGIGDPAIWEDWLLALWNAAHGPTLAGQLEAGRGEVEYAGSVYHAETAQLSRSRFRALSGTEHPARPFPVRGEFDEVIGYAALMEFIDHWYWDEEETVEELIRDVAANRSQLWDHTIRKWLRLASDEWQLEGCSIVMGEQALLSAHIVFTDGTRTEVNLGRFADEDVARQARPGMARFIELVRHRSLTRW